MHVIPVLDAKDAPELSTFCTSDRGDDVEADGVPTRRSAPRPTIDVKAKPCAAQTS